MSKVLLLEVGTEEIPAAFLPGALADLRAILSEKLEASGLPAAKLQTFGTPRRMAVIAEDLPERQPEGMETLLGPPVRAAFDRDGKPTRAASGFARKHGLEVGDLLREKTGKGEYVAVRKKTGGVAAIDILSRLLPEAIAGIHFRKTMRWGEGDFRFARPIHWIVALLGHEVIPFSLGGVSSGNHSRGHRFIHPGDVKIGSGEDYAETLAIHNVIVDPDERRSRIESEVHAWAATVDGTPVRDPALLELVTFLVELPSTVRGGFDAAFLDLPREVLVDAMRKHQYYFSVENAKGDLLPYFIAVLNVAPKHHDVVARGNERVLRARLADARFFFDEDRKKPLEARVEGLRDVLLHAKLGSVRDKVERLGKLVAPLAETLGEAATVREAAKRAAHLCKADLVTHMVGEFPDLQGVMGREYALADGESPEVAEAIEEHYRPRHAGAPLPESPAGALLAVTDKLDTLAGCFHAGLVPTATRDPYALRRAAIGIIAILEARPLWRLPLDHAVREACALHGEGDRSGIPDLILAFFRARLQTYFGSSGSAADVVEAVLSARLDKKLVSYAPGREEFSWDVPGLAARVSVLSEAKKRDDFAPLARTFKRVVNILPPRDHINEFAPPRDLKDDAEMKLIDAFKEVRDHALGLLKAREYGNLFKALRKLKAPVDQFFEQVRVMDADNPDLQAQRLGLLKFIADLFYEIADFSKIAVEHERES